MTMCPDSPVCSSKTSGKAWNITDFPNPVGRLTNRSFLVNTNWTKACFRWFIRWLNLNVWRRRIRFSLMLWCDQRDWDLLSRRNKKRKGIIPIYRIYNLIGGRGIFPERGTYILGFFLPRGTHVLWYFPGGAVDFFDTRLVETLTVFVSRMTHRLFQHLKRPRSTKCNEFII